MPKIDRGGPRKLSPSSVAKGLKELGGNVGENVKAAGGWLANSARKVRTDVQTLSPWKPKWEGVGCPGRAGWLAGRPPPVTDSTARFKEVYEAAKAGKQTLPAEAKDHKYLVVGGLFTDHYPGYMKGNLQRLSDLGLDAQRVKIDSDTSVEANAKTIRDAILSASKNGRKVVLVGQSKGGVDITAAVAMYPELKGHVRAVVAMQSPYGGTPVASDLDDCPSLRRLVDFKIKDILRGDPRSLVDLRYDVRQAFVERYPYPSDIPTVSLATSRSSAKSLLNATASYIADRYGLKSDGLVVDKDAEIPGSRVVRLDDMDHAESVMQGAPGFTSYKVGDLTQALVSLALEQ